MNEVAIQKSLILLDIPAEITDFFIKKTLDEYFSLCKWELPNLVELINETGLMYHLESYWYCMNEGIEMNLDWADEYIEILEKNDHNDFELTDFYDAVREGNEWVVHSGILSILEHHFLTFREDEYSEDRTECMFQLPFKEVW